MYGCILVLVDRSGPATIAVDHALEIAHDQDAIVALLYVADTNEPNQARLGTDVVDVLEQEDEEILMTVRE